MDPVPSPDRRDEDDLLATANAVFRCLNLALGDYIVSRAPQLVPVAGCLLALERMLDALRTLEAERLEDVC